MIPHTPTERLLLLEEIEKGEKVVIPISEQHAKFMILVAQKYLDDRYQETIDILKKNYE